MKSPSLAGHAVSYVAEPTLTEGELLANLAARGIPFTPRKLARLREDEIVRIAAMEHRGAFGTGRFARYDRQAVDLVEAVVELRLAGARKNDLVVRLALAGHAVPPDRLLRAMRDGARPLRSFVAAPGSPDRLKLSDCVANALERSPAERRKLGIVEPADCIDSLAREIVDDLANVVTLGVIAETSRLPNMLRHRANIVDTDAVILRLLGLADMLEEIRAAAASLRAALTSLDDATPEDAAKAAAVLAGVIALRNALVQEGASGNALAGLLACGLSMVQFESAFGLFFAFAISKVIDKFAAGQRLTPQVEPPDCQEPPTGKRSES